MSAAALRAVETRSSIHTIVWDSLRGEIMTVPSWMLYDRLGSDIFVEITEQPEYQQTNWEIEILRKSAAKIAELIGMKPTVFYEFGAG